MTPSEKAKDISDKIIKSQGSARLHPVDKESCIVLVDEILDALHQYDYNTEKYLRMEFPNYFSCEVQNMDSDFRYWNKVKEEINKL